MNIKKLILATIFSFGLIFSSLINSNLFFSNIKSEIVDIEEIDFNKLSGQKQEEALILKSLDQIVNQFNENLESGNVTDDFDYGSIAKDLDTVLRKLLSRNMFLNIIDKIIGSNSFDKEIREKLTNLKSAVVKCKYDKGKSGIDKKQWDDFISILSFYKEKQSRSSYSSCLNFLPLKWSAKYLSPMFKVVTLTSLIRGYVTNDYIGSLLLPYNFIYNNFSTWITNLIGFSAPMPVEDYTWVSYTADWIRGLIRGSSSYFPNVTWIAYLMLYLQLAQYFK